MVCVPPKNALAGFWQVVASNASTIALLTCPAGSVIDMDVSFTLSNNLSTATVAVSSGPLGTPVYLGLDGSTNTVQALGVPTTH